MEQVRKIVTLGLEARQKAGIKVRQPLALLEVKSFSLEEKYIELIKDEINVKEVRDLPAGRQGNKNIGEEVLLDVKMTEELKQEGDYRELVRALQDMRKKTGLTPSDVVKISFETNDMGKKLIQKFEADMKKTVLASEIELKNNDGQAKPSETGSPDVSTETFRDIKIDELLFRVKIEK